jgi:CBS domain-containing protein
MAFEVKSLLAGKAAPVIAGPAEPALAAFNRMRSQDFGQLPVVEQERVLGMISHESVLRAAVTFGCGLEKLTVRDGMTRHRSVAPEMGMAELLEALAHSSAVLVVERGGRLVGIVTDYDVTQHFRGDLEDRMNLEDIELALRHFVAASFGGEASPELADAVRRVAASEVRPNFERALRIYLGADGRVDPIRAEEAFEAGFAKERPFQKLSFGVYAGLLTEKARWERFMPLFGDKQREIQEMLRRVRDARNDVAHLRGLTAEQRELLRFCAAWLERAREAQERADQASAAPEATPDAGAEVALPEAVRPVDCVQPEGPRNPRRLRRSTRSRPTRAPTRRWRAGSSRRTPHAPR